MVISNFEGGFYTRPTRYDSLTMIWSTHPLRHNKTDKGQIRWSDWNQHACAKVQLSIVFHVAFKKGNGNPDQKGHSSMLEANL